MVNSTDPERADPRRFRLGAATTLDALPINRDWLVAGHRDVELSDAVGPDLLDSPARRKDYARRVNELLDGHRGRRGIHGPFHGIAVNCPDPAIQEVVARRFIQSLEFSATFGASHMVIHSPFQGWANPFLFHGAGANNVNVVPHVRATLEPVLPVAERLGITLVMENIRDLSLFAIMEVVKAIDSPRLRVSLDVGHCQTMTRLGGMTPDKYILEAGEYLEHLHLQDGDGESDRHWAPGDGLVSWYAIFHALRQVDTNPRMILELKDKSSIQRGARYLESSGFGC